ncbi:MAG TPA: helix-turn-helix domain-containing protein [Thermoplasmata archaeon]|nr:helix-turn-helix domain-containing protein [Thermoplasmata archaeon]
MNRPNQGIANRRGSLSERKLWTSNARRPPDRRAPPDESETERLVIATLNVRMSTGTWTMKFTTAHPDVRAEVLNRGDIDPDVAVSDYWISGGPPGTWTREIRSYPDVVKVDALAEVGGGSLYRVTDRNPPVVYLYRRLGLPLQFPMRMQAGYMRWEVVSRKAEFEQILRYAREVDAHVQVLSIRNGPLRSHLPLLTSAQQALLTRAMAEGYFAVPRGITLTELAKRVNRSKSSVSEAIATIEKKLLESALGPPALTPQ